MAIDSSNKNLVVGTTTLFIEPKFINRGMKIGYIEDVSVRKGYQKLRIGSDLVNFATNNAILKRDAKSPNCIVQEEL